MSPVASDVERRRIPATNNPYQSSSSSSPYENNNNNNNNNNNAGPSPLPLPPYIDKLKRLLYMGFASAALHKFFNFFRVLSRSPHIVHGWFQVGLACTVLILCIKAYVEMYEGHIRHRTVDYQNFRHTTHTVMLLIGFATVAFNCALWKHYGWNTPFILCLFFFGVIIQFLLLVPTTVQNVVAFILFTFFLQEYSGYSNNMIY